LKTNGPGVYDHICTKAREESDADMAIVIIINGCDGNGFSVQARQDNYVFGLPDILENMAKKIRADLKANNLN
jgi:hypothetical protein